MNTVTISKNKYEMLVSKASILSKISKNFDEEVFWDLASSTKKDLARSLKSKKRIPYSDIRKRLKL